MKKNVSSQFIGVQMTYIASGTPVINSGSVLTYLRADALAMQLGAVNSGICIPNSYGLHHYIPAQSETNYDWMAWTFVASGAANVTAQLYTMFPQTGDGFTIVGSNQTAILSNQTGINSLYARVGEVAANAPLAGYVNSGAVQVNSNAVAISSLHTRVGSVQTGADNIYARIGVTGAGLTSLAGSGDLANVFTRLGAPAGTNFAADVASIQTMVTSIYARVGAPAGATIAADIAAVLAGGTANGNAISSLHTRVSSVDTRLSSAATQVGSLYARVGERAADAPLALDVGSIQTLTTSIYARVGAPAGASLAADVALVQTGVTANGVNITSLHTRVGSADTRISSAAAQVNSAYVGITSLAIGVNVDRISSDANAAGNLYRGSLGTALFTAGAGSTTGILSFSALSPAAAAQDQFKGRIITFDRDTATAALRGQATDILSNAATGVMGVTSLTTAPSAGDKGVIT